MAKSAILTVDDDQEVLRSVERDLRSRYADKYRVLRADSGKAALDTLHPDRSRPEAKWQAAANMNDGPRPGPAGNQRAGYFRGWRCAKRVGQARGIRRGRGFDCHPADYMFVFFEGSAEFRRSDGQVFPVEAGEITGMLPFSRLETFQGEGRSAVRSRIGRFHKQIFPEMIARIPLVGQRLVALMTDRVREVTRMDVQQEKLMALGKLSAGLAHELNTRFEARGIAALVHEIKQSVTRIFELVKAIKDYSCMDQALKQEIDIHDGLESTLTILAFKLRNKSVNVVRDYDRTQPKSCTFGVELNQVWTNLVVNAIEAMKDGGELRLRTWGDHNSVCVEMRDNGAGIPAGVARKIFDPFFTTKGVGEGIGLGLDTVQRITNRYRGQVSVEWEPGNTRFTVRLPKQGAREARTNG